MPAEALASDFRDASKPAGSYGTAYGLGATMREDSGVAVAGTDSVNRPLDPEWAAMLLRIRDAKDTQAFASLFQHFAPRVKAFLIKSGAGDTLAEDCTQDVMTTVWQKAHLFDPTRASVATWIFTIARNRKIDILRKQRRPEPEDLPWGPEPSPEQADVMALQQDTER